MLEIKMQGRVDKETLITNQQTNKQCNGRLALTLSLVLSGRMTTTVLMNVPDSLRTTYLGSSKGLGFFTLTREAN